jgi:hypothetical protein
VREPAGSDEVFRVTEPAGGVAGGPALSAAVDELVEAAVRGDELAIHKALTDLIPSFVSSLHLPERRSSDRRIAERAWSTRVE